MLTYLRITGPGAYARYIADTVSQLSLVSWIPLAFAQWNTLVTFSTVLSMICSYAFSIALLLEPYLRSLNLVTGASVSFLTNVSVSSSESPVSV